MILFFLIFILMVGSVVIWSIRNGISPMPTSSRVKKCLMENLPDNITGTVVEMGSGWGTLAFPIAKKLPHCHIIGYENSPVPFMFSKLRHLLFPMINLKLYYRDFYPGSLQEVSMVVCYLFPSAMRRLKVKFEKELKPGTWVVSHTFAIPGWKPKEVHIADDIYQTKIYLYQI